MSTKTLSQLRSGNEFLRYAKCHGAAIRNGHGSHMVVITDKGQCVVPNHPGDLGKGLRCKVVKIFILIGLGVMPITCLLAALIA